MRRTREKSGRYVVTIPGFEFEAESARDAEVAAAVVSDLMLAGGLAPKSGMVRIRLMANSRTQRP